MLTFIKIKYEEWQAQKILRKFKVMMIAGWWWKWLTCSISLWFVNRFTFDSGCKLISKGRWPCVLNVTWKQPERTYVIHTAYISFPRGSREPDLNDVRLKSHISHWQKLSRNYLSIPFLQAYLCVIIIVLVWISEYVRILIFLFFIFVITQHWWFLGE